MHVLLIIAVGLLLMAATALTFAGLLPFLLIVLVFGLGAGFFIFWIWMLVDAIQNRGLRDGEKVAWVLAIVFLHLLAAILYFFLGRPKRNQPLSPAVGLCQHATR